MEGGGWPAGNLMGIGEWKANKRLPDLLVKDPQREFENINIRYEMNKKAFKKAGKKVLEMAQEIWNQKK
jgi:biotin synthase-related radical SAM superfamily protein